MKRTRYGYAGGNDLSWTRTDGKKIKEARIGEGARYRSGLAL